MTEQEQLKADAVTGNNARDMAEKDPLVPGTAQIRKITTYMSPMELLEVAAHLAEGGYEKKLFSVLSRVFTEKKGFGHVQQEGMREKVQRILDSDVPAELKMQAFTSFELPQEIAPERETAEGLVSACSPKRLNIAAFFIAAYGYEKESYRMIVDNKELMKVFILSVKAEPLLLMYERIMECENKEYITGVTRAIRNAGRRFAYTDKRLVKRVTEKVFDSREVFYTSKILFCLAFSVPADCLPPVKEMYKILKISVNYDEKATRDFVKRYHSDFDVSEAAMCRYYLGNKKAEKEKPLVEKFAAHVVRVEAPEEKRKLLHMAFKRGGMFRMYAGCMQDGSVNEEKQRCFRYSEEDIAWVKTLPGLHS